MKKLFILAALAWLSISAPATAQTDARAKTILESATKKINSLKSLKANFAIHLISANGKTQQSKKGSFFLKGTKYRVDLGDQQIICNNKTVWTYLKSAGEVQISNFNPEEQSISPAKLFTSFYDKEYRSKYLGTKKFGSRTVDMIELTPVNKSQPFSRVELAIEKNGTIAGGNIFEKNGNHYRYEVSGFTPNPNISDAMFTFDPGQHPGTEVVDLR